MIKSENQIVAARLQEGEKKQEKAKIPLKDVKNYYKNKRLYIYFDVNLVQVENKKLPKKYH